MNKRGLAWVLTFALCVSAVSPALADQLTQKQEELDYVRMQMEVKRQEAAVAEKKV